MCNRRTQHINHLDSTKQGQHMRILRSGSLEGLLRQGRQALTSPAAEKDGSQGGTDALWMHWSKGALHCMLPLPSFAS
jgi:hypothetical protein